jgi:hypothetical protein
MHVASACKPADILSTFFWWSCIAISQYDFFILHRHYNKIQIIYSFQAVNSAVVVKFYLGDAPLPYLHIPSPLLSSPPLFPLLLPPFPPLPFEWGSGGLPPENVWNDICSQASFSEFWVLNSTLYCTGVFVHTKYFEVQIRVGEF